MMWELDVTYTIFGCIMLRLQRSEQRLLGTENLDGGTRRLCEVHERSSVRNEACTDELANERSKVRRKCLHTRGEVVAKVLAMSKLKLV